MDKEDLIEKRRELVSHHRKMADNIRKNLYDCSMESMLHGEVVNDSSFGYEPKKLNAELIEDIVSYVGGGLIDQLDVCLEKQTASAVKP